MPLEIEVWLRGNDYAVTDVVDLPLADPAVWTDDDVRRVLEELLRAIDRAKNPEADPDRPIALRGFSWIVSPFEGTGQLITVEIQLGAASAGPFPRTQSDLEDMIRRVLRSGAPSATTH
jgi:hypothetical protein